MGRKLVFLLFTVSLFSCRGGFQENENGLRFKFHVKNEANRMAKEGEMALCYYTIEHKDTTLYSTYNYPDPARIVVYPSTYKGDLFNALRMMHEGDSASFIFNADSFYQKTYAIKKPERIKDNEDLLVRIKLFKVVDDKEFEHYLKREEKEHIELEKVAVKKYIQENYLSMNYDSLTKVWYDVEVKDSLLCEEEDIVTFHCLARTLEGVTIINTYQENKAITVQLGHRELKIPVMEELLYMMGNRGTGKFIVPYLSCFGPKGDGNRIPQYSTFVFDIFIENVQK